MIIIQPDRYYGSVMRRPYAHYAVPMRYPLLGLGQDQPGTPHCISPVSFYAVAILGLFSSALYLYTLRKWHKCDDHLDDEYFSRNRRHRSRRRYRRNADTMPHPEPEGWDPGSLSFPVERTYKVGIFLSGGGRATPQRLYETTGTRIGAQARAEDIVRQLRWSGIDAYAGEPRRMK